MAISQNMADRINEQIAAENESAFSYSAMSYKLKSMNLTAFAKWFKLQAEEEREHASKLAGYLLDQGEEVKLKSIPEPKADWKSCKEICEAALGYEKDITKKINDLVSIALKENDHATYNLLLWFVTEQVEEEASAGDLLNIVSLAETPQQVFMLEGRVWHMVQARTK